LFIKEVSLQEGLYPTEESAQTKGSYLYSNCQSVTVVERITSSTHFIEAAIVHDHSNIEVSNKVSIKNDGWYRIWQIVLPTQAWAEWAIESGVVSQTDEFYVISDNKIYKNNNMVFEEVDVKDLLDPEVLEKNEIPGTFKDTFVLYNLWQCYLNYCRALLADECLEVTNCETSCDDNITQNRNLIYIFLNAIQYYVYFGQFEDAQDLLEQLSGCNTLCSNEMFSKDYNCGCG
jgi:hypothetical protein